MEVREIFFNELRKQTQQRHSEEHAQPSSQGGNYGFVIIDQILGLLSDAVQVKGHVNWILAGIRPRVI